ncbi:MAG TPA: hypothetical protein PLE74_07180 [Candidatus Cloacimonadota bacterium]|nr:hypothetical protein [Candidatus Cloacimonadota bacterium]
MKTKFTNCVKAFYGKFKSQGLVHCKYNKGSLVITRKYPIIEIEEHHHTFGNRGKNLAILFHTLHPGYINDLKIYTRMYANTVNINEKIAPTHYNLYLTMMWNLKHQFPEIDMATISKEDILDHLYPVITISQAVSAGLLQDFPEAHALEHQM